MQHFKNFEEVHVQELAFAEVSFPGGGRLTPFPTPPIKARGTTQGQPVSTNSRTSDGDKISKFKM